MARTRQQKELMALAALAVAAAGIWYLYLRRPAKMSSGTSAANYAPISAQDYIVIINGLAKAQGTEYKSAGRNIFVMGPMPVEVAQKAAVKAPFPIYGPQPPAPPPPPVLPAVFFGYGMVPAGGARQAFLKDEQGDGVYIVSEGDVVLNHYRILHIGNERIDFEDTTTGLKGSRNLEAAPSA
jgi:hypothetical protein